MNIGPEAIIVVLAAMTLWIVVVRSFLTKEYRNSWPLIGYLWLWTVLPGTFVLMAPYVWLRKRLSGTEPWQRGTSIAENLAANSDPLVFILAVAVSLPLLLGASPIGELLTQRGSRSKRLLDHLGCGGMHGTLVTIGLIAALDLVAVGAVFALLSAHSGLIFLGALGFAWTCFGLWWIVTRRVSDEQTAILIGTWLSVTAIVVVAIAFMWWKVKH